MEKPLLKDIDPSTNNTSESASLSMADVIGDENEHIS